MLLLFNIILSLNIYRIYIKSWYCLFKMHAYLLPAIVSQTLVLSFGCVLYCVVFDLPLIFIGRISRTVYYFWVVQVVFLYFFLIKILVKIKSRFALTSFTLLYIIWMNFSESLNTSGPKLLIFLLGHALIFTLPWSSLNIINKTLKSLFRYLRFS